MTRRLEHQPADPRLPHAETFLDALAQPRHDARPQVVTARVLPCVELHHDHVDALRLLGDARRREEAQVPEGVPVEAHSLAAAFFRLFSSFIDTNTV